MNFKEPTNWMEAAERMQATFPYTALREAPAPCAWSVIRSRTEDRDPAEELRRAEAQFVQDVESAIHRYCSGGRLLARSDEIAYFLGLRTQVVALLLDSLSIGTLFGGRSMFPYPDHIPFVTISQWFLVDWWRQHGYDAACKFQLLDECFAD